MLVPETRPKSGHPTTILGSLFTFFDYLFFRSDKFLRVTTETASRNPNQTMQEVTSVKCPKAQKEYFTVIKNVKQVNNS